jgi:cytochrome c biogenesis protein CcmG, thiol:disulfide interchange protein DsbE
MRALVALSLLFTAFGARAAAPALPSELPVELAAYKGKLVYLDFWASWCGPCAQSFPWLNHMQDKYRTDLVVVGVNVDTDAKAADRFLQQHPATFEIVRDPIGKLPELYRAEGMPSSLLISPDGHVLHQHSGFRVKDANAYEAAIKAALPGEEAKK